MLKAYIGFSTPNYFNPISWLVRKITHSQCSHAWAQYYCPIRDRDMVVEAHELGFREVTVKHFEERNRVIKRADIDGDFTLGLRYLTDLLGDTYDYGGLFGMAWVELARWFKKKFKWWHYKITNPLHWAHNKFCSSAMITAMQVSNSKMAWNLIPDATSPQELLDSVRAFKG
jgi:hypothetical protein